MSHLRSRRRLAIAALLLFTAACGAAEPAAPAPPFPADTLVPNDEARALFELLETDSAAGERLAAPPPAIAVLMDLVVEPAFAPGELVPDWRNLGVSLRQIVTARDGGTTENMAAATGPFGPLLIYFVDEPIDSVVSRDWILVARLGQPFEAEEVRIEVSRQSPKVILAERVGFRRQGRALCRERSESRLYSDPRIPASEADSFTIILIIRLLGMIDRKNLCHIVEEREPGVFVARYFDGEGHRRPIFDSARLPFRITARAPASTRPDRP